MAASRSSATRISHAHKELCGREFENGATRRRLALEREAAARIVIDRFDGEHAFLSNFFPSPVTMYGDVYPTVEHAFQAAKTQIHERAVRKVIRDAATPGWAKRLGRRARLRPDWETFRLVAMETLLRRKFADPALRALLEKTRPHELIEGNNWGDTFWGMVFVERPTPWDEEPVPCLDGENHLGRLLMKIRDEGT